MIGFYCLEAGRVDCDDSVYQFFPFVVIHKRNLAYPPNSSFAATLSTASLACLDTATPESTSAFQLAASIRLACASHGDQAEGSALLLKSTQFSLGCWAHSGHATLSGLTNLAQVRGWCCKGEVEAQSLEVGYGYGFCTPYVLNELLDERVRGRTEADRAQDGTRFG